MEIFHEEFCMQNLPENVKIVETHLPTGRHRGVFSGQRRIAKGTRFGPYTGNIILPMEMKAPEKNSVWEVINDYNDDKGRRRITNDGLTLNFQDKYKLWLSSLKPVLVCIKDIRSKRFHSL